MTKTGRDRRVRLRRLRARRRELSALVTIPEPPAQEMGLSGFLGAQPLGVENRRDLVMDALAGAIQISRKKRGADDGND